MNSQHLQENEGNWTSLSHELRLVKICIFYTQSLGLNLCVGVDHENRKGSKRGEEDVGRRIIEHTR